MRLAVRTPWPLTRKVRPDGVPAGIFTRTVEPSKVGTSTWAPRAASGNVTGNGDPQIGAVDGEHRVVARRAR